MTTFFLQPVRYTARYVSSRFRYGPRETSTVIHLSGHLRNEEKQIYAWTLLVCIPGVANRDISVGRSTIDVGVPKAEAMAMRLISQELKRARNAVTALSNLLG